MGKPQFGKLQPGTARRDNNSIPEVAGNGLLHRRALLGRGIMVAGAMGAGAAGSLTGAAAEPLTEAPWSVEPGGATPPYGRPSPFEKAVVRTVDNPKNEPGGSRARTPHHLLKGTITPNGLHFTIMHAGIPDIDPAAAWLSFPHSRPGQAAAGVRSRGAVALSDSDARRTFNAWRQQRAAILQRNRSRPNVQASPWACESCAEWAGVPLATLLDEAGVDPSAKWIIAEGADAPHLSRSVPLAKVMDDAIAALYQNGERIQPGQGYPMRLPFCRATKGNMNVKFLRPYPGHRLARHDLFRNLRSTRSAAQRQRHAVLLRGRRLKSYITSPSPRPRSARAGPHRASRRLFSAMGGLEKVLVSADGGKSWGEAALDEPRLPKAFTRFSMAWRWDGGLAVLQSRAWDEGGNVQPTRELFVAKRGQTSKPPSVLGFPGHHFNAITSWEVRSRMRWRRLRRARCGMSMRNVAIAVYVSACGTRRRRSPR